MVDDDPASADTSSRLADRVDDAVDANPVILRLARLGWIAKAIVYWLMGFTAAGIALQRPAVADASPQGSIGRIADAPLGRIVLAVMTVGLICYFAWRVLSVALIGTNSLSAWADRIGYSFSAVFYAVLAWSAGSSVFTGNDPGGTNSVERISQSVLEARWGRVLLGVGGAITIAIGTYFAVEKGVRRSFADELDDIEPDLRNTQGRERLVVVTGLIGWVGRGIVLALVGYFVIRSAVRFDPSDARGFDRSLREIAGSAIGSAVVLASALCLQAYAAFCALSIRYRSLDA